MNELLESFIKHLSDERNYSEHTVKAYRGDLENFRDFLLKEEKKIEDTDKSTKHLSLIHISEPTRPY